LSNLISQAGPRFGKSYSKQDEARYLLSKELLKEISDVNGPKRKKPALVDRLLG